MQEHVIDGRIADVGADVLCGAVSALIALHARLAPIRCLCVETFSGVHRLQYRGEGPALVVRTFASGDDSGHRFMARRSRLADFY
jgi:hypothetical protein